MAAKSEGKCRVCENFGPINNFGYCIPCFRKLPPIERKKLWREHDTAYFREYRKKPEVREKKRKADRAYQKHRYAKMKKEEEEIEVEESQVVGGMKFITKKGGGH